MPLAAPESLPSLLGEAAQMAEQLFSRSSSPHGRTATIVLRRRVRHHHHHLSSLAAGDAGAALGRGHRHTPLSRASVPPPLPSHFPLPRALALPCYRVRDPGREISQFRPVLTRFFFNEPLCFLLASLEDELFFLRTKNIRYIFYINVSYGLLYSFFFLQDLFPFSIFLLDKRHRGNLEREILFRINVFTPTRKLNFHILDFS